MTEWTADVVLQDSHAVLEPLAHTHAADLQEAAADGALHELWYTTVPSPADVPAEIERRLGLRAAGTMMPFAVIRPSDGKAVGMTTYMNMAPSHKRLEIGSTWYRKAVQRTPLNTQAKRLLLAHAFEALGCICVEFRTHFVNMQSRRAIERLGAKLDGVLRSNMILANGTIRDTAVYSIIAHEWPTVRANLDLKLAQMARA